MASHEKVALESAGAELTEFDIPSDRVIDGIDQTALLMDGDTHGRRDHVFIYAGPELGATVKGNYKRHWISPDPVGAPNGFVIAEKARL